MTTKEHDIIIESILSIKNRIDNYVGRERHLFLIACRANIRLSKLIKSKRQFAMLPEYEEYSRFVDEQLDKSASALPTVITPAFRIEP
ncbi:MAG TPA: hypothetical protein VNV43_09180 [Candidatus Acidoferrales bacterium]|jgi:hypothetical protein|nr:hypothetical protein [Candidatus Acidoferrales bacterium]